MQDIVDEIISCGYENLPDIKIPYDKKVGLEVIRDSVKYEFIIHLKSNSDKLLVMGPGAINDNSTHDRTRPIFHRWSWEFDISTIHFNDPTLYLSDDILGGWGLGSMDNWYLKKISNIFNILIENIGFENKNVIFYGSSLGGFMSIMLATMIKNSVAIAEIPQLDVTNWTKHWGRLKTNLFDDLADDYIKQRFGYKLDVIELMKIENYIPNAYLLLDCSHDYDFKNIYLPFFNRLNELPYDERKNNLKIKITGKNKGHAFLPYNELVILINKVLAIMDSE